MSMSILYKLACVRYHVYVRVKPYTCLHLCANAHLSKPEDVYVQGYNALVKHMNIHTHTHTRTSPKNKHN